jgi:hypothetical protein
MHEEPVEGLGEVGRPVPRGQGRILPLQEAGLVLDCISDVFLVLRSEKYELEKAETKF